MERILLVSDTHGQNNPLDEVIAIEQPDYIIHCGDHQLPLTYLFKNNIFFVKGNNDVIGDNELILTINQKKFIITHGHQEMKDDWHNNLINKYKEYQPDFICYGHSHKELSEKIGNIHILNPGSLNYPRNKYLNKSYIIIDLDKNNFDIKIKYLND